MLDVHEMPHCETLADGLLLCAAANMDDIKLMPNAIRPGPAHRTRADSLCLADMVQSRVTASLHGATAHHPYWARRLVRLPACSRRAQNAADLCE